MRGDRAPARGADALGDEIGDDVETVQHVGLRRVRTAGLLLPGSRSAAVMMRLAACGPSGSSMRTSPELRGALRAHHLLAPRKHARHEDRALVQRQDLAERVVAGHGHEAHRTFHQLLEMRVEGGDFDATEALGALAELALRVRPP